MIEKLIERFVKTGLEEYNRQMSEYNKRYEQILIKLVSIENLAKELRDIELAKRAGQ